MAVVAAVLIFGVLVSVVLLGGKGLIWEQKELEPLPATSRNTSLATGLITPEKAVSRQSTFAGVSAASVTERDDPLHVRSGEIAATGDPRAVQSPMNLDDNRSLNSEPGVAAFREKKTTQVAGSLGSERGAASNLNSVTMQDASPYLTIKVIRDQTLRRICLKYLGHYDVRLLRQVRALNPTLDDPDFILAGQRLRLPKPAVTSSILQQTKSSQSGAKNE